MVIAAGVAVAAAATIGSAALQAGSAQRAARTQAGAVQSAAEAQLQAQRETLALQERMFEQGREDIRPYREIGTAGLQELGRLLQPGGYLSEEFVGPTFQFEADPGYQFRLQEGMKAIERSASARGMVLSGRTLSEVARYGSNLAAQEYGAAYGRFAEDYARAYGTFQGNRTTRFNRLAALAGIGQTSTTTGLELGQRAASERTNILLGTAGRVGELGLQAANARASGYVAGSQAWGQALSTLGGLPGQWITLNMLNQNQLRGSGAGQVSPPPVPNPSFG